MTKTFRRWGPFALAAFLALSLAPVASAQLSDWIDDECIDERTGEVAEGSIAEISDVDTGFDRETEAEQESELDEDSVLLAIALDNNDIGVDFDDVRSFDRSARLLERAFQESSLDRDDAFGALVLGEDLDTDIDCIADVETTREVQTQERRDVDLDEEDTLLAIAIGNSLDDDLDFGDVSDVSLSESSSIDFSRDFDLDREDVFTALLFGSD